MIKLRDILIERSDSDPETVAQIWDGKHLKFGKGNPSLVRSIQTQVRDTLDSKYPGWADKNGFKPDGDFGGKTVKAIAKLLGTTITDPSNFAVGPKTLTAVGFKQPEQLPLDTKILAATITGEGMGNKDDMKAIANVILNRSTARDMKLTTSALERKQFSMWNQIVGKSIIEKTNNVINNWGGGLKSAGNIYYWKYGVELAKQIQQGQLADNTNGATHYFTGPRPYWAKGPNYKLHSVIGKHEYGRDMSSSWAKNPVKR